MPHQQGRNTYALVAGHGLVGVLNNLSVDVESVDDIKRIVFLRT